MTGSLRYRILQIGALSLWEDRGDSLHARELAFALLDSGIEPVLLNLPGPPAPESSKIIEVRPPLISMRFLRQMSWNVIASVASVVFMKRYDVKAVYSRMEPGIIVGLIAAILGNRPLVVELNGLPSEDIRLYRPNNHFLLSITRAWEGLMYGRAAKVIGSPGYIRYVQEHFDVPANKCVVAPLGVNTKVFRPLDRQASLASKKYSNVPTVVWTGSLAGWQGLETLVTAAEAVLADMPHTRFVIVGQGLLETWLKGEIVRRSLGDRVEFVGHVPYDKVNTYLGCASICVGTFPGNRGDVGSISSLKTMTYLASGRPVVTSAMDEMGESIQSSGAGLMVTPDDPKSLAVAMKTLLSEDESVWRDRCEAARALAEDRTWGHKASIIVEALNELVNPNDGINDKQLDQDPQANRPGSVI